MHTNIDHNEYPKALRTKSYAELMYIVKDATEAMNAMPDGHKAGYYADEVHYANMEMNRRRNNG